MSNTVPHTLSVCNRVSGQSISFLREGYSTALSQEHKRATVAELLNGVEKYVVVVENPTYDGSNTVEIRASINLPLIQEEVHTEDRNRLLEEIENLRQRNEHLNHLILGYESNIEELTAPWYRKLLKRGK